MRCLALAQAWQAAGGRVVFAMAESVTAIEDLLAAEKMNFLPISAAAASAEDAAETARHAREQEADWLVLDGYRFDHDYVSTLHRTGRRLLLLDDDGRSADFPAELLLNQNAYATPALYGGARSGATRLLGSRFTMLRRGFIERGRAHRTTAPTALRILVTFGAADPANTTGTVVVGLASRRDPDLDVTVIIGAANPHHLSLEATVRAAGQRFKAVKHVTDLSGWMRDADLAITAAGSTCWELAYMQVPQLVVAIADNQRPVARVLAERGAAVDLGWHADLEPSAVAQAVETLRYDFDKRKAMQRAGRAFIDGEGAARVVLEMRSRLLQLRAAGPDDGRWIWELANEPGVRAASFNSDPIPWEDHRAWFERRLVDPATHFYIAADESGDALGQVRFDVQEDAAVISTSLVPSQRGRGYGSALILAGCRRLFAETEAALVRALIKPDNTSSVTAFTKAGFSPAADSEVAGQRALQFVLNRQDLPEYADL